MNSLNYTQSADTLLVVHPDVSPRQITRGDNEEWKIGEWEYYTKDGRVFCPFYNYYNHKAKINPRGTGGTITVLSETNIFTPDSVGSLINVRGGQIKISEYVSASEAKAVVNKGLSSTGDGRAVFVQAVTGVADTAHAFAFAVSCICSRTLAGLIFAVTGIADADIRRRTVFRIG